MPDHIILEIIKERIKQKDCRNGYIFDGFPRNIKQENSLEKLNNELNEYIDYVFYFEIPFDEIIKRLSNRRVCKKCSTNYNLSFNPPKKDNTCDLCGGELYQREDDKEETVKNRLKVFAKATMNALVNLKDAKNVAKLRGKSVLEMYSQHLQPREVISNEIK
ncbi:unnamed protein product [marine sediment metagenome]|uniref:Adenylate kinase active site lid domain-containing protein n=1 Tax=marine sediment metagenome TaxID=412755 RepID=X0YPQ8_9ZZZZ